MTESSYGIRKAETREILQEIDLLPPILHKGQLLDIALFGTSPYRKNIQSMSRYYFHSKELPRITFRPATTAESISAVAYKFEEFGKPNIFCLWLSAGWIVRTSEGVFANPPRDINGEFITDEQTLKSFLTEDKKINEIYLLENDFGFAPYESFKRGGNDCENFAKGGLARVLEHTPEKEASLLKEIASNYRVGVSVWNFKVVKDPILSVVSF